MQDKSNNKSELNVIIKLYKPLLKTINSGSNEMLYKESNLPCVRSALARFLGDRQFFVKFGAPVHCDLYARCVK
jgi:hypothetical protein